MLALGRENRRMRWGTIWSDVVFCYCGCPQKTVPKFSTIRQSFVMLMVSVIRNLDMAQLVGLCVSPCLQPEMENFKKIELPGDPFILWIQRSRWLSVGAIRSSSNGPVHGDSAWYNVSFPTAWWLGSRASSPRKSHLETGEPSWLNLTS